VFQDLRKLLEDLVAGLVAVRVVHGLEAIQVAHDAGEGLTEAARVREHLAESMLEVPPVVESRQRVGLREVHELLVHVQQLALPFLEFRLEALDAQHRVDARPQLREVDRLGDVVVSPGIEALDLRLG